MKGTKKYRFRKSITGNCILQEYCIWSIDWHGDKLLFEQGKWYDIKYNNLPTLKILLDEELKNGKI
jgi:hypothetical protein